jgi:hypothetical protein
MQADLAVDIRGAHNNSVIGQFTIDSFSLIARSERISELSITWRMVKVIYRLPVLSLLAKSWTMHAGSSLPFHYIIASGCATTSIPVPFRQNGLHTHCWRSDLGIRWLLFHATDPWCRCSPAPEATNDISKHSPVIQSTARDIKETVYHSAASTGSI